MKKLKALLLVLFVYILALGAGAVTVWLIRGVISSTILVMLLADVAATIVVFISSIPLKNASIYDPYWSVAPPFIAVGYYFLSGAAFLWTHLFVLVPLCAWAVRLTYNWALGFTDLKWQDWRYTDIKAANPKTYILLNFVGIMLMPTLLVFAGMIPFYYFLTEGQGMLAPALSGAIMLFATLYQATADRQKREFLQNLQNKGKVIDTGLWRFSRHPNYFGEVTLWWGMFVCSLGNFFLPLLLGPVAITLLFLFISIPMMTRHMLRSRPQYADYMQHVRSPLFPLPLKKKAISAASKS